jgi:hypothetical protein
LNEFSETFLATGQGSLSRVVHSKFEKQRAIEALRGLGGSVIWEIEGQQAECTRYEPTFLGLLLSPQSNNCENLLVGFLSYSEDLFLKHPEKQEVTSEEVERELNLTKDRSVQLYRLIMKGRFHGRIAGFSPDNRKWSVGIMDNVDDLPSWNSKMEFIHKRAMQFYEPNASPFWPERLKNHPSVKIEDSFWRNGRKILKYLGIPTAAALILFLSSGMDLFKKFSGDPLADEKIRVDIEKIRIEHSAKGELGFRFENGKVFCRVTNTGILPWEGAKIACRVIQIREGRTNELVLQKSKINKLLPQNSEEFIVRGIDPQAKPHVFILAVFSGTNTFQGKSESIDWVSTYLWEVDPKTLKKISWTKENPPDFNEVTGADNQLLRDAVKYLREINRNQ